jgi:DNA processing protein
MNPHIHLHALASIPGVGAKTLIAILNHFDTPEEAWESPSSAFRPIPDIGTKTLSAISDAQRNFSFERASEELEKNGIRILPFFDPEYPKLLREIPDFPPILYVRGNFTGWNTKPCLTIIGSRNHTAYGRQVAAKFATEAIEAGFVVVSGLAFGIDSDAHQAALDAHGETIAILGSGIDDRHITPQSHLPLARSVMQHGALVSEYPPGMTASKGTFPARNRIMAGLSAGTLVVEAMEKSGTAITARLALDYNREVFAVPGSIFSPLSAGCHHLIRQGGKPVTSIADILEEYPSLAPGADAGDPMMISTETFSPNEMIVWEILSHEALHIDMILKRSTLETTETIAQLTFLELKGLAKNIGGQQYIRMN